MRNPAGAADSLYLLFALLQGIGQLFQTARLLDIHSLGTIFLRLSRFWGATVVLCFVAWFLFPAEPVRGRLLTIVFVGLASLTMPHMFLDAYAEA